MSEDADLSEEIVREQAMIVVEGLRKSIRNGARTVEILRGLDF